MNFWYLYGIYTLESGHGNIQGQNPERLRVQPVRSLANFGDLSPTVSQTPLRPEVTLQYTNTLMKAKEPMKNTGFSVCISCLLDYHIHRIGSTSPDISDLSYFFQEPRHPSGEEVWKQLIDITFSLGAMSLTQFLNSRVYHFLSSAQAAEWGLNDLHR